MLLRTVSLNRTVSCVTMPICFRSDERVTSRTSWPSIRMRPAVTSKKRGNQVNQRALAGAAGTNDGENFAALHFEIDAAQDLARVVAVGLVGKADSFEPNALGKLRKSLGAGLFEDDVFRVHELEELRGCAQGLLEAVIEDGKLANRIVEGEDRSDEGDEGAQA